MSNIITCNWLNTKRIEIYSGFLPYINLKSIVTKAEQEAAMTLMGEISFEYFRQTIRQAEVIIENDPIFQSYQFPDHTLHLKDEDGNFVDTIDRRPEQSWAQAIAGWLFYPIEISWRPGILFQLAASAFYGNIEAWAQLGKFASEYTKDYDGFYSKLQEVSDEASIFLRGFAAYLRDDYQSAEKLLLEDTTDPRSFYYRALMAKFDGSLSAKEIISLFQQSSEGGFIPPRFELARLDKDHMKRLKDVYEIGCIYNYLPAFYYLLEWRNEPNSQIQEYLRTLNLNEIGNRVKSPYISVDTATEYITKILSML